VSYIFWLAGGLTAIYSIIFDSFKNTSKNVSVGISTEAVFLFGFFLLIIFFGYLVYRSNCPYWTILKFRKITRIKDKSGKKAEVTLIKKMQANYKGLSFSEYGNIAGTGGGNKIKHFILNGERISKENIKTGNLGALFIKENFEDCVERNQVKFSTLSYIAEDCYLNPNKEDSGVPVVSNSIKKIVIEVHLPKDKPAKKAYVLELGGHEGSKEIKRYNNVDIYNKNTFLEWEKHKPKTGRYFKLIWEW
jgi:hypothetical protein